MTVCVCVCVCVCFIMAIHPTGMGRYDAPAMYILLSTHLLQFRSQPRPANRISNALLNIGKKRKVIGYRMLYVLES